MTDRPQGGPQPRGAGLVEALWLGSVLVTALFFNRLSMQSFEPDKAELLRALALVAAVALLFGVGRSGEGTGARDPWRWLLATPLLRPALLLCIAAGLATWLSVDPGSSLWGSYPRRQGLATQSAYMILFVAVAVRLRSRRQLEHLVSAFILAAVPMAVFALMQHQGLDPTRWSSRVLPIVSTQGNTVFLAAWLVMVVPLVLHRLAVSLAAATRGLSGPAGVLPVGVVVVQVAALLFAWPNALASGAAVAAAAILILLALAWRCRVSGGPWLAAGCYAAVLAAVLASVLLTERRGPILGLGVSLCLFAVLHLTARHRFRAVLAVLSLAGATAAMLVATLVFAPSLLQGTPFERLAAALEGTGSTAVRLHIWDSVLALLAADPLRAITGYGPETQHLVLPPFSHPEIASGTRGLPDRTHSETLDVLVTTGLAGLFAYLLLAVGLFRLGLHRAGLLGRRGDTGRWLAAGALTAVLLLVAARLLDGSWRLAAVALPVSLLGGTLFTILTAALRGLRNEGRGNPVARATSETSWSVTLFAALVAHLVEVQVGIGTVATQTAFWLLAAALAVLARLADLDMDASAAAAIARPAEGEDDGIAVPWSARALAVAALLLCLTVLTLAVDLPLHAFLYGQVAGLPGLFALTIVLGGAVLLTSPDGPLRRGATIADGLRAAAVLASSSVLLFCVAAIAFAVAARLGTSPSAPLLQYVAWAAAVILALAVALQPDQLPNRSVGQYARRWVAGVVIAGVAVAAGWLALRPLQADVQFKRGLMLYERRGDYGSALAAYGQAIELAPAVADYRLQSGRALASSGLREAKAAQRDAAFGEAVAAIERALALQPLNPVAPETLGLIQLAWGEATADSQARRVRLEAALAQLEAAGRRNPSRAEIWLRAGDAASALQRPLEAIAHYRLAAFLDAGSCARARDALNALSVGRVGDAAVADAAREVARRCPR